MTWKEIKIATLQKMNAADGNDIPTDNSAVDYLAAMPQACNEALQLLSTANKFIIKTIQIAHMPVENLISDSGNIHFSESDNMEFCADGAKSFYFECCGVGKADIYVGDALCRSVEINSKNIFTPYKGIIENSNEETVRIVVQSLYPFSVKNMALYKAFYADDSDVAPYGSVVRYNLKELAEDFFMVYDCETYFEGNEYRRYPYSMESGYMLVLDRNKPGNYVIHYKAYPVEITQNTEDDYELPLASEVASLLPLYMASQIYKDDDIGIATTYRNEFEVARELLQNPSSITEYENVESESGWI